MVSAGDTGFKVSMSLLPVLHKLLSQQLASPHQVSEQCSKESAFNTTRKVS